MASSKMQVFNELNFDEAVLGAPGPVLVDFTASWCRPCRVQSAVLDRVIDDLGDVVVGTVDVDECPALAARCGVRGMPTLVAFQAGREIGRRLGLTNEQGVRALVPRGDRSGNFRAKVLSMP